MKNFAKDLNIYNVEVLVKGPFINLIIFRLNKMHINVTNIKYIDSSTIKFDTKRENVKILKKEFKDYKISITNEKGVYRLKKLMFEHRIFWICLLVGLIFFLFCQNIIVKVDVIHSDKKIRELVAQELEEYGVKRLTLKKNYKDLQEIKQKVLEKYPDKLEWIEIENIGMTYKVRVEERILTEIKEQEGYCNIVASKSGILTKIINKNGMTLKFSGDYVSKGDIIIAGDIKVEEEIKKSVCAQGTIYGEVWYTVNVTVPLDYKIKTKTGEKRSNFMYETKNKKVQILRSRFTNIVVENKKLFSLLGTTFYYQKEYEVTVKEKTYTQEEALKQAEKLAKEKVELKLSEDEKILTQKVLNITQKDSTIDVEVFVSVEENIGKEEYYIIEDEAQT